MDIQLDNSGDPTMGMHSRDLYKVAESILESIRDLQQDKSQKLPEILIELCRNKLDVDKLASE